MRVLIAVPLLFFAALAAAQETLLGAGIRSRPDYDGADKQEVDLIPVVRWYGEPWFARTTQGILEGGARVTLAEGLAAGAQLAYEAGNDRSDVDPGASFGLHVEWDTQAGPAPITLLGRTRHHMDGGRGMQADARATVGVYGSGGAQAGVFAQATWASGEWIRSYYAQGDGGLWYTSFGALGSYELSQRWLLVGSLEYRRLHGDARTSPITEKKANVHASAGLAYRF